MAKVKIQGHASGTGILTVTAPNTSTDRTITLPDATGTLLNSDGSGANLTSLPVQKPSITDGGNATAMTITSDEQVLIGTATALSLGDVAAGKMQLVDTDGGALRFNIGCGGASADPRLDINTATTTTATAGSINFTKTHHNTLTTLADVVQGEALGGINWSGVSRTNANYNRGAYIRAFVSSTGTVSSTYVPTDLHFSTQDTSTDRSPGAATPPQLRIMSDGRGLSQFTAKAWINLNGTGTIAINDSHNVSSITDNSTGDFTVTFSNAMANADYSMACAGGDVDEHVAWRSYGTGSYVGTTFARIGCMNHSGSYRDRDGISAIFFGD